MIPRAPELSDHTTQHSNWSLQSASGCSANWLHCCGVLPVTHTHSMAGDLPFTGWSQPHIPHNPVTPCTGNPAQKVLLSVFRSPLFPEGNPHHASPRMEDGSNPSRPTLIRRETERWNMRMAMLPAPMPWYSPRGNSPTARTHAAVSSSTLGERMLIGENSPPCGGRICAHALLLPGRSG